MRKRIVELGETSSRENAFTPGHLPIAAIAQVEVTSEDPAHPIQAALSGTGPSGWRAGTAGQQRIALVFDQPERVRKMTLKFVEAEWSRTHEFVLTWSDQIEGPAHIIVRQQWTFSPAGATTETETYEMDLAGVRMLELMIKPDLNDPNAIATLSEWRVFSHI